MPAIDTENLTFAPIDKTIIIIDENGDMVLCVTPKDVLRAVALMNANRLSQ